MPTPVSLTVTDTRSTCGLAMTETRPPDGVNFAALVSRLSTTCEMRVVSASSISGTGGISSVSVTPAVVSCGCAVSTALSMIERRSTRSLRSVSWPRVMRLTSIRSSISRTSCEI